MQAILTVVEYIKKSLVNGQVAAAVFYDFADAFGSVDHYRLLEKVRKDFNIRGLLLLHITSFLSGTRARIKIGELTGDWLKSEFGTSARMRLGPLLFIMHLHDVPGCVKPKFADDQSQSLSEITFRKFSQIYKGQQINWCSGLRMKVW